MRLETLERRMLEEVANVQYVSDGRRPSAKQIGTGLNSTHLAGTRTGATMNQLTLFDRSNPDPLPTEECTMSSRKKVKTVRATSGRHRFVVLAGKRVLHLSKQEYTTVGDAKSAGKAKAREIKVLPFYGPGEWPEREDFDGLCRCCLHRGVERDSVRLDNSGTSSDFCRDCWEEQHPGQLERWGVA